MDFYTIKTKETRGGILELYPDFRVGRSKDLMIRGRSFYAIWDEEAGLWSTDEYDVQRLVDKDLREYAEEKKRLEGISYNTKDLHSFGSQVWSQFRKYMMNLSDNNNQLDNNLTFANTPVKKSDYASRRLPYSIEEGDHSAWDELIGTLYSVEERAKIEWAIGAVVSGDAKKIQKFLVLYGPSGTGKSTVLNIVQKLFDGYCASFEAKALGSSNNQFGTEAFKNNPLVAVQHDGDLSHIDDNTKLNSIIAHEDMAMNEKYKPTYTGHVNAFLFMGTNQPVKISDAKSGIIRRLIDVRPTGIKIPTNHYFSLMAKIDFELGAIAQHCLDVYLDLGRNHYTAYRPIDMMFQTDVFFNFIEANFDVFKQQDGTTLKQAYTLYKEYCLDTGINQHSWLPQYKLREELRSYFDDYHDNKLVGGKRQRNVYLGFNANKFKVLTDDETAFKLVVEEDVSLFDTLYETQPAQYANAAGTPARKWETIKTTLADIDTKKMHYVQVPENHIVIDFDLKEINGTKSLERNLEAASSWPATYAELSKSGNGVHLHYLYEGDTGELGSVFSEGIEIKVFRGDSSLRRLLTKCNSVPVSKLTGGLPLREKKMLQSTTIQSEKGLRDLIARNLRKEIHPGTKPSIDFIHKILEEAFDSGMKYDVTDLRSKILAFANNSSNNSMLCLKMVQKMQFASEVAPEDVTGEITDERLVLFDVEVFPNLFIVCWKYRGDPNIVRMINPKASDIEPLFHLKLVGFNNRRFDNHMLYAASMGYNNQQLFELAMKLVNNDKGSAFGSAYNLSYADVWDISSIKMSLKKFEVELGIHHMELDIPWGEPVDEKDWDRVADYCCNDVIATEAVLDDRWQDYVARQILAELSGLAINDTTQRHTAQIIFGKDRDPQKSFIYTNLEKEFDGYVFDHGSSTYRGETVGEGGYVYAEPGIYSNVALLDVASMHPTSIAILNLFGDGYTGRFSELVEARLAIKRKDYEKARHLLDGKLSQFLGSSESDAEALSYSLKIVINIVYGLTSAKFTNPFRDPRNIDNIVAKRGALFMIDLKHAVQERGFTVAHIKTDSIKIPDATAKIIKFVQEFGKKYGYTFEHEATYDKFVLVNDAVYVARQMYQTENGEENPKWTAVGAQFQHPYVFKKLFSHEEITFNDMCEAKSVLQGVMYLDFEERDKAMALATNTMRHVGKTGLFVPVVSGGGTLYRVKEDKYYAVSGTKGYQWIEAEMAIGAEKEYKIDTSYFENLVDEAFKTIDYYGPFTSLFE
jgi:energy-coupling factor transporter ATP-binding protein EcfA2